METNDMKPTFDKRLDEFTLDELHDFGFKPRGIKPITEAKEVFPDTPKGYVKAFKDLTHYATNQWCNLTSEKSNCYSVIAQNIYLKLPIYAKLLVRRYDR